MKYVTIFCGAHDGNRSEYRSAAVHLVNLLVAEGATIVFGGAKTGIMGLVADTALAAGGAVIGVIPDDIAERNNAHASLSELHVVDKLHERKSKMYEIADCCIALPGGIGTLDELSEFLTLGHIGLSKKPLGILNTLGYYDPILQFINTAIDEAFIRDGIRNLLFDEEDPVRLIRDLKASLAQNERRMP